MDLIFNVDLIDNLGSVHLEAIFLRQSEAYTLLNVEIKLANFLTEIEDKLFQLIFKQYKLFLTITNFSVIDC